ncbi:MAG: WD40/YVTN/BNR-like repeat-containing protein, partial [Bacteroidia bacterium]
MKRFILCCFLLGSSFAAFAQQLYTPSATVIAGLPDWAQEMYSTNPNVLRVDSLYKDYFTTHAFVADYNTKYYRIWRKKNALFIGTDGFIHQPNEAEIRASFQQQNTQNNARATWTLVGAEKVFGENGNRLGDQTNTYCIDQSETQDSVLFCGTEPGEIYKSIDAGTNWFLVSANMPYVGGITAIEIDPSTSQIVYAGANDMILQSLDGGQNWNPAFIVSDLGVNEILVNPLDPQVVLAACTQGLYRSTDGGVNWTAIFSQPCYDVKFNAANADLVYLLKNNPSQDRCEFFSSTDRGATFTQQTNGWYNSNDPNRVDMGARLAVSVANPNRIYAYLIGDAKANDYGFIGVYRSDDGGASWSLPNGPDGGPYTATHQNLAYGVPSWTYHQGFYNCAIMASPTNADMILI